MRYECHLKAWESHVQPTPIHTVQDAEISENVEDFYASKGESKASIQKVKGSPVLGPH